MTVHAWFNVLLTANFGQRLPPDHVIARHPEWVMQPQAAAKRAFSVPPSGLTWLARQARVSGDVEGLYLSPSAPGVGEHLEAAVRGAGAALSRGRVPPGLHPLPVGRVRRLLARGARGFARRLGVKTAEPWTLPARYPAAWDEHRRAVLSDLAARLARAARARAPRHPGVGRGRARRGGRAQPSLPGLAGLGARGVVDAVCPMAYTADSRIFRQRSGAGERARGRPRARVGRRGSVPPGRARHRGEGPARAQAGASGVILFSHESLRGQDVDRLRREAFPPTIASLPPARVAAEGLSAR